MKKTAQFRRFADRSFDRVFAFSVFEYFPDDACAAHAFADREISGAFCNPDRFKAFLARAGKAFRGP